MSNTAYNLHLKGYVSGAAFDRNTINSMLAVNDSKRVNVLIDSLSGSHLNRRSGYVISKFNPPIFRKVNPPVYFSLFLSQYRSLRK